MSDASVIEKLEMIKRCVHCTNTAVFKCTEVFTSSFFSPHVCYSAQAHKGRVP